MELKMGPSVIILPERLDPVSVERMRAELATSRDASAIILEGIPNRFCLGMDFVQTAAPGMAGSEALRQSLEYFAGFMQDLLTAPRPTLAVIDGPALGGGLGLAAACDVVIASDRSSFGLPEALYGLAPAIIRPALMTRLNIQKLNMLLFTCHSRNAQEAKALGLVDYIVPLAELERTKREVIRQLRRARSETVATARNWNKAQFAAGLQQGVTDTNAALADAKVIAALRATDENVPWNN
jgi:enoyl-CoA hydratase/carnithine racemase